MTRQAKAYLREAAAGESKVTVKLEITISPSGSVKAPALAPKSHESSAFGSCLLKRAKKMRFPRNKDRNPRVTYPFKFHVGK